MSAPEPLVLQALQGFTDQSDKWPGPRAVKVFVASVYNEFREERRQILELVGPELQSTYDDRYIEFEFVDMHYGTDGGDEANPALLRYHLDEIKCCHNTSRAGYFLCFLGGDTSSYQPVLPFKIDADTFERLIKSDSAQTALLRACYRLNGDGSYHLEGDEKWYSDLLERDEQRKRLATVQKVFHALTLEALEGGANVSHLLRSPVEIQCELAIELLSQGKHPKGLIVVLRDIPDLEPDDTKLTVLVHQRLKKLQKKLEDILPETHIIGLEATSADSSRTDGASDTEEKLSPFRDKVQTIISSLIDDSLSTEPDQGKGRKKTVQEVFLEHITHLRICIEHNEMYKVNLKHIENTAKTVLDNAKENYVSRSRHPPVLIYGPDASGKSTLLTHLYVKFEEIFPKPVLRIIRFSASTPRSAYNLELLRVMCQQISIILNIPEGYLPKDASFDPLYINNWFQSLLRRCEEMEDEVLLIFIDNVHRVNPLECDIVTGLSWLPMSLPRNVFLVCTSAVSLDQLQLTPAQKEKFKVQNCYYLLDAIEETPENNSSGDFIDGAFDNLEVVFGSKAFSKVAGYITCSEFGLTELELLELLMPTSNSEAVITLKEANFNFSTLCVIKHMMKTIIAENVVSGRSTWRWRAAAASARARRRYVRVQSALRDAHSDLAALHFANFLNDADDTDTSETQEPGCVEEDDALLDSTPFHSASRTAAAFTQRHVEESWLHLLLAGDFSKLKDLTVCNFDFLLAAVQTVTVSYLRCILEHVRCYILDRDVELVYGAVRKSSDILTRDPMQLGAQIIAWLRPAVARRGVLATLVTAAMAWCDGYDKPLLVPLNGWLHPPISSTVRLVSVGGTTPGTGVRLLQLAPSGQHLVLAPSAGDPQLWHVMSNSKVHTFKGHSGRILCMCVTRESQYLLTGSEDTSVIVWDLHTLAVKTKILEHIAPVLCVAAIVNRSLVISGGEDSAVIVTSLVDGALVTKLDHHRGPITAIKVIQDGDILVTCSQDGTVCTWNVDNFSLLSTVSAGVPIHAMEVTEDNVFLVTLQGENELHIRTFITGTHLHVLKRHKTKVKCFCVAHDSSRAAVGCADQRIYVYSLHSAQLLRTLAAAHDLSALAIADKDHFLLAAGGNRVTIYSFHTEDNLTNFRPTKQLKRRQTKSTTNVTLLQAEQSELIPISCLEVSRDGQLAASGCARGLVRVWQLSTHRLQNTLSGHMGHITCVTFSPNNLMVLSGSEDRTVVVWQLADNSSSLTYKGHQSALQVLLMMSDGRRAMSGDRSRMVHVWLVDSGIVLLSANCPTTSIDVTLNMKFAVLSDGDNSVRIWTLAEGDSGEEKRSVSHAERITCFALTADSQHVVTGSMDMSLKVWQLNGGKLSQVLVGHSDIVTCVAVSITNKTQVVSGSWDYNLIVWDINTGSDVHLLSGHLGKVTCVKVTGDGTIAVSGAEDKTLIIWETKRGLALTSLSLHVPALTFQITSDCSRIVVHLLDRGCLPIICLHNTPATYVKIPTYAAPTKNLDELRPLAPKRPMRRLLKKEVSLDTYTWQKKYGHLTSAAMMAQVDERLKRRFSVSASMEEISKIQEAKNKDLGSQVSLGPEQAAIAQSQHFDQLEALWNKISPPRRRSNKTLSKQSSLIERVDSSDEDHTPVEEQGHSGRILCMCVTRESQYLLTGSEDTSVIVWDLHTLAAKTKILEHIAPVLCVAAIVNRSLVISGGEDSAVIVTSLVDGALVTKLDHHRGPITAIKVIQDGDILVTCSQDGTVCTWNVDNFSLLSTVSAGVPIHAMEVTEDNVFLVTLQGENELHIRTFITGTHLHVLKRHKTKVKCFCVAHDSSRAAVGCADQRIYVYSLHSAQLLRTLAAAHDLSALAIADKDHFLLAAGGNRVTIYSFHTEDNLTNFRPTKQLKRRQTKSTTNVTLLQAEQSELIPISCLEVSRDGQLAASGCARGLVRVWQLSTHRLQNTLSGHMGHITCVTFSPNNLMVLSGSEDRTVVVWQLADNSSSLTYKGHQSALQVLLMMSDGRRAMSGDRSRMVHVWLVDSGIVLLSANCPTTSIDVTLNMKFAVLSDGDNSVRIWTLAEGDSGEEKRSVSHAERITCFALTADSQHVVTGSMDMSLKVWQLNGGKLSQVLVGHSDIVTCVAVSITNKTQVVSGSWDYNLIVWDINTGSDVHLLSGHLGKVTCVKVTGDGTIAVSGAEDKTLIIWETKRGLALTSLSLHVPALTFQITSDCSRIVVHLLDRGCLPIICLHNTPATYVKIPTYAAPTKNLDELRPLAPKRPMRRLLKKEVSLDTYTWQKKYGHLTSAAMMAQVDERLKRRFSVSASMEEISKIQEAKNKDLGSQVSLGPEQAAIAQSQHFDHLEALWNKISPPRRRSNKTLSKQSSLIERVDSSDEDHTPVEEQEHMVE